MSRPLSRVERERKARVRRLRRENTRVDRLGRGRYRVVLVVDHQTFELGDGNTNTFSSRVSAHWTATQLAIALNRLKFGD